MASRTPMLLPLEIDPFDVYGASVRTYHYQINVIEGARIRVSFATGPQTGLCMPKTLDADVVMSRHKYETVLRRFRVPSPLMLVRHYIKILT